jgi:NAD(P)H-quinone oxidoreductase subunit 5
MSSAFALLAFLGPAALAAVAVLARSEPGRRPVRVLRAAEAATAGTLALSAILAGAVAVAGPATSPLVGFADAGLSARLDALSATMLALVSLIGAIVVRYSRNYMDGDPRHGAFVGGLCLTLAAVLLLVVAGNLVQFALAWIATSLALHRLLVFYPDRPAAAAAARKKAVAARVGDACLVAAFALVWTAFGTGDVAAILEGASAMAEAGDAPASAQLAALLIAVAALLKSAQFPTHGWLPEVMETPTPVSALLHAGIINAGGFLVVRFADVMLLSAPSMHLLALVGGFTALFASVVMLTQTSVKVALAWSTAAQMGFMMLQCGLGVFPAAVLHIVAHSLYKAHAFLSSGSVVEIARASWVPSADRDPHPARLGVALAAAVGLYLGVTAVLGGLFPGLVAAHEPAVVVLGAVLVLGLAHLIAQAMDGRGEEVLARVLPLGAGVAVAYVLLQSAAAALLSPALPPAPAPGVADVAIMVLVVASFGAVTALQLVQPARAGSPAWRRAYVHLSNGLYANAAFDRLVGALRIPASRS